MTMLHRETDAATVERNVEAIFDLHAAAIEWLDEYTASTTRSRNSTSR